MGGAKDTIPALLLLLNLTIVRGLIIESPCCQCEEESGSSASSLSSLAPESPQAHQAALQDLCGDEQYSLDILTHVFAAFGPSLENTSVTAASVIAEPFLGCSPLNNTESLTGKIVIAGRGDCNFTEKVLFAQERGAVAVVVINYEESESEGVIMKGTEEAHLVQIPSVFLSYRHGDILLERHKAAGPALPLVLTLNETGEASIPQNFFEMLFVYFLVAVILFFLSSCLCIGVAVAIAWFQKGARKRASRNLATRRYVAPEKTTVPSSGSESYEADQCAICLEEFEKEDLIKVLPCKHEYHAECVDPWLEERSALCPLCKQDALPSAAASFCPSMVSSLDQSTIHFRQQTFTCAILGVTTAASVLVVAVALSLMS